VQITKVVIPESVEKAAVKLVAWFFPTLGVMVFILCVCCVVIGMDMSDRHAQDREFDRRAAQAQREADQRAAQLVEAMTKLDRQYRMTELKLDDWTVTAHRAGIVLPDDYARGPQGNPDAKAFNIKPKGK
jgi:hypothetical protein